MAPRLPRTHPRTVVSLVLAVVVLSVLPQLTAPGLRPATSGRTASSDSAAGGPPEFLAAGNAGPVAPAAGPTVTVDGLVPTGAALSWTGSGALLFNNYTVEQTTNVSSGNWQTIAIITNSGTTSLGVTDLTPASAYAWRVTSYGLGGGQTSSPVLGATPGLGFLNVTVPTTTSAELNWTNNATYSTAPTFVEYRVYETAGTGHPTLEKTLTSASNLTWNATGLSAGAGYAFYVNTTDCVSACGSAGAVDLTTQSNVVTIGTPEPLVASMTVGHPIVDANQSDLLSCTPAGGRSPYQIAWDDGNGTYVAGLTTRTFQFASPGSPVVRCQVTDALASSTSIATTLTVDSAPSLAVSVNRSALDAGGSVSFNCTTSGGTQPYATTWEFGDGNAASTARVDHTYAAAGHEQASCSVIDFVGVQLVRSLALDVSVPPSATAMASSSAAAPNTTLTFQGNLANGSGNATALQWQFGDGQTAAGGTVHHAFARSGSFSVTVRSTDSNGVTALAAVEVVISALQATIDPPGSLQTNRTGLFSATASGGAGAPYNFSWNFGDGSTAYGATVAHAYRTPGVRTPQLTVRDRLGATATFNASAVTATAPPPPPTPAPPVWIPLLGGLVAFAAISLVALQVYRRHEARALEPVHRWVPPTDPQRTLRGTFKCRNCGTLNNAARESCSACGAPAGGGLFG